MSTIEETNKALIREITDQIWNQRKVERIPEFWSPEYVANYRPYAPERKGHDAIRAEKNAAVLTRDELKREERQAIINPLKQTNGKEHGEQLGSRALRPSA